ncbi:MAG: dTDP-4-dehydrorhamnose reductase, partial [Betaproteobacteria bacterium]|nr:dTDP-4-dehydrorhamnose reductase [Betaproteobacteria bacterium]
DHATLDLASADAIRQAVRAAKPDVIINAAAYTAVDKAEGEPELAMRINGAAPGVLGEEAKQAGALLVHYSTDYVFDGAKRSPYLETDPPKPLSVYGRTKLEGETRIQASGCCHLILRPAWVYGQGSNFVRAILRQAEKSAGLRVVNDQIGAPSWARDIARVTSDLLSKRAEGTLNVSAAGSASWYEVALEILRLVGRKVDVQPVSTAEYGAKAPRPAYSVLDNGKLRSKDVTPIGDWRGRLAEHLKSAA